MPDAIKIPQVENAAADRVISSSLLASMALSKDSAISSAANTVPTIRNEITPDEVPSVSHPSQPDRPSPITVTSGHL